jgi:hypothetical protein
MLQKSFVGKVVLQVLGVSVDFCARPGFLFDL